ncbi:MAG: SDR family oxidoreductase [Smithellaceae bacterium]
MAIENKVWYVTGASQGLGLSLVRKLLTEGYKVAATSRSNAALEKALGKDLGNFLPLQVDLTTESSVRLSIEQTIQKFGRIDVVVNNAGYAQFGTIEEVTDAEVRNNFTVNVFGVLNVLRNVLPYLRAQQSGYIFNISSMGGYQASAGGGIYAATKFAVDGLSESLAGEVKQFGIKVISVKPGFFRTNFLSPTSMLDVTGTVEAYKKFRDGRASFFKERNGNQAGDPEKAANVIICLSKEPKPPLHLFLGSDAYSLANGKMEAVKKDMAQWQPLATSTDFDQKN